MRHRTQRSPSVRILAASYRRWAADEEAVAEALEWSNALIGDSAAAWQDDDWLEPRPLGDMRLRAGE